MDERNSMPVVCLLNTEMHLTMWLNGCGQFTTPETLSDLEKLNSELPMWQCCWTSSMNLTYDVNRR